MWAELSIRALTDNDEIYEFSLNIFNNYNKTEEQFKTFIENNKDEFAREACDDSPVFLEYIGVTDLTFRED